jgi:hypothetical protein
MSKSGPGDSDYTVVHEARKVNMSEKARVFDIIE